MNSKSFDVTSRSKVDGPMRCPPVPRPLHTCDLHPAVLANRLKRDGTNLTSPMPCRGCPRDTIRCGQAVPGSMLAKLSHRGEPPWT